MHMQLTTNSVLVWKRRADESEQSARMLTRISIVLMIMMFVTGAYAYSTRARVSEICSTLQARFQRHRVRRCPQDRVRNAASLLQLR